MHLKYTLYALGLLTYRNMYTEKNVLLKITMFYCNRFTDSNSSKNYYVF